MTIRKRRTLVESFGDVNPADHGGGALMREGSDLVIEYTDGARSNFVKPSDELTITRKFVPTIGRGLCDVEAIRSELDWCDWNGIRYYNGFTPWELLEIALDPTKAWLLYELAASYHGWNEIRDHEISLPYWRVERRWTAPARKGKAA